ncbi:MAG: Ig-like domain-containing protein [Candidatus Omnitrophica bacterium]|nr:Ig-like domain-containing protein [Candidatus Omnitrophota bacterium]
MKQKTIILIVSFIFSVVLATGALADDYFTITESGYTQEIIVADLKTELEPGDSLSSAATNATDLAGNVYFIPDSLKRIYKVIQDGSVSTFASLNTIPDHTRTIQNISFNANGTLHAIIRDVSQLTFEETFPLVKISGFTPFSEVDQFPILTADIDGNSEEDLVVNFGDPYGIWIYYNASSWVHLNALTPESVLIGNLDGDEGSDIIFDFGSPHGIWVYYGGTAAWEHLNLIDPELMVLSDVDRNGKDDIIIDFGPPHGIWVYYDSGAWTNIHGISLSAPITTQAYVSSNLSGNTVIQALQDKLDTLDRHIHPTLEIIPPPGEGDTVSGIVTLDITSNNEEHLYYTYLYVDNKYINYDNSSPFSLNWDSRYWENGEHTIKLWAYFRNGIYAYADKTITLTSQNDPILEPSISITSPVQEEPPVTVSGQIDITTDATADNFNYVYYYLDGSWKSYDNSAPFEFTLDTTTLDNGVHTIKVYGYHKQAAQNVDDTVTVDISN